MIFLYDPYHPVPTAAASSAATPRRCRRAPTISSAVEARHGRSCLVTPPLAQDVEVTGPVTLTLWAATSAADTDFTGKLVDIYPDGYSRNLTDGIIRARYRQGTDEARPITPGEPTEYTIDLWATSNLFKAGHRIGLEVSSSNFPRFDRNLNTGHELGATRRCGRPCRRFSTTRSTRRRWCCRSCRGRRRRAPYARGSNAAVPCTFTRSDRPARRGREAVPVCGVPVSSISSRRVSSSATG